MKTHRLLFALVVLLTVLGGWSILQVLAESNPPPTSHFVRFSQPLPPAGDAPPATGTLTPVKMPSSTPDSRILQGTLPPLPLPADPVHPQQPGQDCRQLLLNSQLDIVELGDDTGRAEPWVIYTQIVYYSGLDYVSPDFSLVLMDADTDDQTPELDAFAQAFYMPEDLVSVTIQYQTATTDTNTADTALGILATVDVDGNLLEALDGWTVGESPGEWQAQYYPITESAKLDRMAGQRLAIIILNDTDGKAPGEWVWFDDITLTACTASSRELYLPMIARNAGVYAGPACAPPSENPQDVWDKNRGHVETNATCSSTLSRLDLADYYTFVPYETANHTLHLRDLPAGSEWSAMIFVDQAAYPPPYAPGPTDGQCRIATTGSGDKSITCPLQGGKGYFVKVSAGAGYTGPQGGYELQIVGPGRETAGIYGKVTAGGAPAANKSLELRYYNGSSWSTRANATTASDGSYSFSDAPSLSTGQSYYVRYINSSDNDSFLYGWFGRLITSYTAGTDSAGGDFDIANVFQVSPLTGSTRTLPTTFEWTPRGVSGDLYRWALFDLSNGNDVCQSTPQSDGDFTLGSSGFSACGLVYGKEYGWLVYVVKGDDWELGYGMSYYYRRVTFSSSSSSVAGSESQDSRNEFVAPHRLQADDIPEISEP